MRGGKRDGAGRRKGTLNRRTREIAEQAATSGLTPLEVMLRAMSEHVKEKRWDQAAVFAKDAAPYMHPRLAAVEHTGRDGGPIEFRDLSSLDDDELIALERIRAKLAKSGSDSG